MRLYLKIKRFLVKCSYLPSYFVSIFYWARRDFKYSNISDSKSARLGELLIKSHVIEKGLSMPNRRLGFGYDRIRQIITLCGDVIRDYGKQFTEVQATLNDLAEYLYIHKQAGYSLPQDIANGIEALLSYRDSKEDVCSLSFKKETYFWQYRSFNDLARSRHSIRNYSEEPVEKERILRAISLAQTAPSACNRQGTRVIVIDNKELIEVVLSIQNGNRGFGYLADKLIVILSDHSVWGLKIRTSAYLDAGIFLMNLLYALHEEGVCTCTLNAQFSPKEHRQITKYLNLSPSLIPIAIVAIGNPVDSFNVARSERLELERICTFINN